MEDETTYTQEGELRTEDAAERIEELEDAKGRANTLMMVFLVLFLLSLGLLAYYQFYQGGGKWKFSFQHKSLVAAPDEATNARMVALEAKNDSLRSVLVTMQQNASNKSNPEDSGTVYEVQIGAFRVFDPSKYTNNLSNMQIEKDGDMTKLTVGIFSTYKEAADFKADVRRMGIRRAWIVKKVNGERHAIDKSEVQ